jgi:hypothetical protein
VSKGVDNLHNKFNELARKLLNEYLFKTESLFLEKKGEWFGIFAEHFRSVCAGLTRMQSDGSLGALSYVEYTMLYTNFINRRYAAEVCVYNEKSYLDKNRRIVGELDISFLFVHFDALWEELLSARKRFVALVTVREISEFMIDALPSFYSYLANIARFAMPVYEYGKFVRDIAKGDEFMVSVGDYMARTEPVYTETKEKDSEQLADWFSEGLENTYIFGDYSLLDFSGHDFSDVDFRYARFNGCVLNNTSFRNAHLIGVNFSDAQLEGCDFSGASLHEADFTGARLVNAEFTDARGRAGLTDTEVWKFAGFLPVNFTDADLTGANFDGADFTEAYGL